LIRLSNTNYYTTIWYGRFADFLIYPLKTNRYPIKGYGDIIMDIDKLIAKGNAWIGKNPTEEDDIDDIERMIGRLIKDPTNERAARILHSMVVGTRVTIAFTTDQQIQLNAGVEMVETLFDAFPHLAIPREKSQEKIAKAVHKALSTSIKAGEDYRVL
tara:strand:+ start:243 stop:716 length:474 start_codon:yes stop_codon:yes gene_type:complete